MIIQNLGACRTYDNLLRKTWIWPYFVPPRRPSGRENSTTIRLKRPQNLTQISFSRFHSLSPTDSGILFLTRHTGCCSPRAYSSSPNGIPTNNCRAPRRDSMMKNHGMKSGSRPTCTWYQIIWMLPGRRNLSCILFANGWILINPVRCQGWRLLYSGSSCYQPWQGSWIICRRTLPNRAFVQILHFRDFKILTYYIYATVLKSLTPKAFGIDQNPWFCKALL